MYMSGAMHMFSILCFDTTQTVIESGSLFSLLNDMAVFIKDSYQRVNLWENQVQEKSHRRLSSIGETRWWSKHEALKKVFGHFGKPQNGLYMDAVLTLAAIEGKDHEKTNSTCQSTWF